MRIEIRDNGRGERTHWKIKWIDIEKRCMENNKMVKIFHYTAVSGKTESIYELLSIIC